MKPPRPEDLPPSSPRGVVTIHLPPIPITFGEEVFFTQPIVLKAELSPPQGQPGAPITALDLDPPRQPARPPDTPSPVTLDLPRYALYREPGCWNLVFDGHQLHLKHEIGILYLSYLLQHPNQSIHGVDLLTRFQSRRRKSVGLAEIIDPETGQPVVLEAHSRLQQKNLAKSTEEENRQNLREIAKVYNEQLRNPATSEAQRALARRQLEHIAQYIQRHNPDNHSAPDGAQEIARSVRKAIYRLRDNLRVSNASAQPPNPVLGELADYIQRWVIEPSSRYSGPKARLARAELAGTLTHEPPPGVLWVISA